VARRLGRGVQLQRGAGSFEGYGLLDFASTYSIPVWKTVRPWVKVEFYNSPKDGNGLATGYTQGANFGRPTSDNQFPQPIPGTNGRRLFRMAFGLRF
jgi:hypothetical protein